MPVSRVFRFARASQWKREFAFCRVLDARVEKIPLVCVDFCFVSVSTVISSGAQLIENELRAAFLIYIIVYNAKWRQASDSHLEKYNFHSNYVYTESWTAARGTYATHTHVYLLSSSSALTSAGVLLVFTSSFFYYSQRSRPARTNKNLPMRRGLL